VDLDPYQELGVAPDATEQDVRAAYKRLAQQHHPDKGGDHGRFERLNASYRTLRDPEKRKRYDEFGVMDSANYGDAREQFIRAQATEVLIAVIDNSPDVDTVDMVGRVRQFLAEKIAELTKTRDVELPALIDRRKSARRRLMHRDGGEAEDPVLLAIDYEIDKLERGRQQLGAKMENLRDVRKFFDAYGYVYETPSAFIWVTSA